MPRKLGTPRIVTSVSVSPEFWELCRVNYIGFTEALRVGISLLLAEKGLKEYDNSLNISRKLIKMREKLEETSRELEEIKRK